MMLPRIPIEAITRVTPLGVRFWDDITQRPISDGLAVTAYPANQPARRSAARVNCADTFIFQDLPGLHEAEFGAGNDEYWTSPPAQREFVVEVIDPFDRFQPFTFAAHPPERGRFNWWCAPSGAPPDHAPVPLFSAPARSVPGGLAVMRIEVWDAVRHAPAAWALLEAHYDGRRIARSYADQKGRVVLMFPYPEPSDPPITSPPSQRTSLVNQSWPIELRAFYAPSLPVPDVPDLCDVLQQPEVQLLNNLSPEVLLGDVDLKFGGKLTVSSPPEPLSIAWLKP
jgi:hypothetical protein